MANPARSHIIRKYCLWCCNKQQVEVRECPCIECDFYSRRMGKEDKSIEVEYRLTARQAMKYKCLDCSSNSHKEVKSCHQKDCVLYKWRLGPNPYAKKRSRPKHGFRKGHTGRVKGQAT